MTRRIVSMLMFFAAGLILPESNLTAGSRKDVPNEVNLELGGKCLLYSFSYQRMVAEPLGLEAGISILGSGSSGGSSSIVFFTAGIKFYLLQKNASPYLGGGIVAVTASTSSGPFGGSGSETYGYISPGFEYRLEGGFLIRGSVYALIADGGFFIWPGLSVGVAF